MLKKRKPSPFLKLSHHIHTNPTRPTKSLSLLADRCTSMSELKQVHAQMVVTGRLSNDNFAFSRLIAFSARGDPHYAHLLFISTTNPNSFMWNTIIRARADGPDPLSAVRFYIDMRRRYPDPPPREAHLPFRSQGVRARRVFGFHSDSHVANGLILCYTRRACVVDARRVFDELLERDLIVWTSMVCGYAQNSLSREALELFDRMVSIGLDPNGPVLASVLSSCARLGGLEFGEKIHAFIEERGIEVGVILGTALVDMYVKNGVVPTARDLFRVMEHRNVATWNAMICGLASHGHAEEALSLFHELERGDEAEPNDVTYVGVLSACRHAGWVDVGRAIYRSMRTHKIEHCTCMVHRNVEVAERVVRRMLEVDPCNHGVFVVLSNMYAEAGRWEDVARLRMAMRDAGATKTPGWSSVNGDSPLSFDGYIIQFIGPLLQDTDYIQLEFKKNLKLVDHR
ncbi:Pentatricopeptide repeat-containing protein [Acorus calamus]|uniref:Pentatricopeptide repeat-containing protein n=1 Tax=Acorus calamus TaxID=4465 RepID=A0AAV9D321_ACOCL|nr:Pentatricopeptide repeat-containing protein [Acorus calamus]